MTADGGITFVGASRIEVVATVCGGTDEVVDGPFTPSTPFPVFAGDYIRIEAEAAVAAAAGNCIYH